jgi:hypothetical protein
MTKPDLSMPDGMSQRDLSTPEVAANIAEFGGNGHPSPVAKINYNVPSPASQPVNRVVPLDVPQEWFTDDSRRSGTSLIELGVVQGDEGALRAIDPQRLARFYNRTLPATARPSLRQVAKVDGEVQPLLSDAMRASNPQRPMAGESGQHRPMAGDVGQPRLIADESDSRGLSILDRRRIIAEPDDVELERRRTRSYLERLSEAQAIGVPPLVLDRARPSITMPVAGPGHSIHEIDINPVAPSLPRLAIIETWELRSYLSDYGLGRTLQTFSLLPCERTTISVATWRTDAAAREDATSIFDSSDIAAQTRFASHVSAETGSAFQDQGGWSLSVATSASASADAFGLVQGSASVESGFAADHQEASQRWSSDLRQAASEHASQVNNSRRQAVESSSNTTTASGTTTTAVREVANTNLRRVLNFVFREVNQTYETHVVLRDIKVAFYNGRPGSAEIVPIIQLRRLIRRHFREERQEAAARFVLALCAERLDLHGNPVPVLQVGHRSDGRHYQWQHAVLNGEGELDFRGSPLSGDVRWRFAPGPLSSGTRPTADRQPVASAQQASYRQPSGDAQHEVDGLITDVAKVVLRTDNIVVEALLGQADAVDPYASELQRLELDSRKADTAWRSADTRRLTEAIGLVHDLPGPAERIDAWTRLFPDNPEMEMHPATAVGNGK